MKKTVLGLVIAAAVGGGYFAYNKVNNIADQQLNQFLLNAKATPIHSKMLETDVAINEVKWQVTDIKENDVKSLLTIKIVGEDELTIPFNSTIIRGKTEYDGVSYGFGKIVTHPDLSKFELPDVITNETYTSTQYIGLDGEVLSVDTIKAFKNNGVNFGGITAKTKASLINATKYDVDLQSKSISVIDEDFDLLLSPTKTLFTVDTNGGNYTATTEPVKASITGAGQVNIDVSKGTHKGSYKFLDGHNFGTGNGESKYDTIKVTVDGIPVELSNIVLSSGLYNSGKNLADIDVKVNTDINGKSLAENGVLQQANIRFVPKSVMLDYSIKNLPYSLIDALYELAENEDIEHTFTDEKSVSIWNDVKNANAKIIVDSKLTAEEGNMTATANVALSNTAKGLDYKQLKEYSDSEKLIVANANAVIDEGLADASLVSMMLQMAFQIEPKDGKYTVDAQFIDGVPTVNGVPLQ